MTVPFPRYVARLDLATELFRSAQRGGTDHLVAQVAEGLCSEAEKLVAAWRLVQADVRQG